MQQQNLFEREPWRNLLLNQAWIIEGQNGGGGSGYYISD